MLGSVRSCKSNGLLTGHQMKKCKTILSNLVWWSLATEVLLWKIPHTPFFIWSLRKSILLYNTSSFSNLFNKCYVMLEKRLIAIFAFQTYRVYATLLLTTHSFAFNWYSNLLITWFHLHHADTSIGNMIRTTDWFKVWSALTRTTTDCVSII